MADRHRRVSFGYFDDYVLEREFGSVCDVDETSPSRHVATDYTFYPIDVWVDPARHETLVSETQGHCCTIDEALAHPQISPTAKAVFTELAKRHAQHGANPPEESHAKLQADALKRVFSPPSDQPSMDGLAMKWLSRNRSGVRHLDRSTLEQILDAGNRAFNLRVADPYLRYQMQGLGFTWSFFTHKDPQDYHVHGAPVVEIYGILEGRIEIWWNPYYDRGTSAWSHRILEASDWLEVDSLQGHIVRWLTEGKGIVFKAGPGPLEDVGKLGVKGKTRAIVARA